MAEASSPATTKPELPTIIIDPSIYEPEHVERPQTLITNFMRLTRVTLAVTAVGGATIGVAHMLELDSLLPASEVAALTDTFARLTGKPADITAAPAEAAAAAAAPIVPEPAAPMPVVAQPAVAQASAAEPASVDEPSPQPPSVAPGAAEPPPALAASAPAPVMAAPNRIEQAHLSAPIVADKTAKKEPDFEGELRNARRLLALNQLEAAEAAYRRVLAENEAEQAALTGLARVQLALGQLDLALASAKRAVDEAPEAASARLALGDILRARGDRKAAQAHYDQAAHSTQAASE